MKKKTVRLALGLAMSYAIITGLTGCGQRPPAPGQTEAQTETERVTEAPPVEIITEKETETEAPKLITSVDYTSKDGSIKITLPDNTWKVTQDADEMRVFQSGNAAIINIVHANTETAMNNLSVMKTEEELKASLDRQYTTENAYEVEEFSSTNVSGVAIYRYVVKYNAQARMWAWSVTNAIVASDQAYVVTGTVTDDNKTLLESVKKAVESFRVLKDETLKTVTGEVISGTPQNTSETVNTNTQSGQEITSLKDYGTTASLVTSDTVNVRSQPGTDASILTTLNGNTPVTVVGETNNWFKVNINGNIGFIRKDFLVYASQVSTNPATEAVPSGGEAGAELNTATNYGGSTTLYASDDANIRSAPGTDSSVVGSIPAGTSVTVIGETDNWFIVSIGGTTSYISKGLLTTDSSVSNGSTAEETATTNTDNGGSGGGSSRSSVSGTVVDATVDTLTIQGDDGGTYVVYYGDADASSTDGLYSGVYVSVNLDASQASSDGTLYATNVTGY